MTQIWYAYFFNFSRLVINKPIALIILINDTSDDIVSTTGIIP